MPEVAGRADAGGLRGHPGRRRLGRRQPAAGRGLRRPRLPLRPAGPAAPGPRTGPQPGHAARPRAPSSPSPTATTSCRPRRTSCSSPRCGRPARTSRAARCCGIEDGELGASTLHEKVFRRRVLCTHIMDRRSLVRDRTVWNKVYRADFWRRHGLTFPPGSTRTCRSAMRAHVLATSVDVLDDVVYHWRRRDEGEVSITQRRTELANLAERLAAIRSVRAFLDEQAPELTTPSTPGAGEGHPVPVPGAGGRRGREIGPLLDLARQWLAELTPGALAAAPSLRRLELHLVRRGLIKELRRVRNFRRAATDGTRIVPRGRRRPAGTATTRTSATARLAIPDEVYDAQRRAQAAGHGRGVRVDRHGFVLRGAGGDPPGQTAGRTGRTCGSPTASARCRWRPSGRAAHGFVADVDPGGSGAARRWRLHARAETRGLVLKGCCRDAESAADLAAVGAGMVKNRHGHPPVVPESNRSNAHSWPCWSP